MPLPVFALFLAAFAFGTTEFVIAGILPDVAAGLAVSIPTAGYLVSGYAIGIAVGAPLVTILTAGLPRKTLLIGVAIVFTLGQVACALAPDFASMLALRVVVAFAHGTFFGIAMVVATQLVGEDRRGMAVALVLAGLSVSNIVGVPLGAAIGNALGWRATFWAMFALGTLSTAAMIALLPNTPAVAAPSGSLAREVRVLGRQQVWTSLIIMLMLMMAQFVPYTFITPYLLEVTRLDPATVPWVLLAIGVGSTIGVFVGGRLADWKLMPSLIVMALVQSGVMAAMWIASPYPAPMIVILCLWGCINFSIGTPVQARILGSTADAPNLASSLIPAGFNVGIAIAAFVGSMLLNAGFGYDSLPLLGIASMLVAATVATLSWAAEKQGTAQAHRQS